ncbi:hypothetical protein GCM10010399_60840 [Dactylosporangium fulvum]|uniref:Gas vesicle protein n=1 Tax=Dactylosporangium fulvum TaxID=53359 RepID=A0ABY5W2B6_9ACTN|nr:hypothetical protein [Dactylosporangium fulvum]UWP83251.1 hypothetical protein Dfulv_02805 [Dactylosporangium fulvum]
MADEQKVVDVSADPVLNLLVGLVQRHAGFQLAITLNVQGLVVTGLLVSRVTWAAEMTRALEPAGEAAASIGRGIHSTFLDADLEEPADEVSYHYVHLIRASMFVGNVLVPADHSLTWRGRISEVSSWSMGSIG